MSSLWDVFISDRLEVARNLSLVDIRKGIDQGEFRDDDLIRPAGTTTPWVRLDELGELSELAAEPAPIEEPPPLAPVEADISPFESFAFIDEDEDEDEAVVVEAALDDEVSSAGLAPQLTVPAAPWGADEMNSVDAIDDLDFEDEDEADDQDEDEAVAEFTLSRNGPEQVEELDLAAMVDVAFQLVLFFLVTATTILYKTLEVPKPNPESAPSAVAQGRGRTMDELERDFIVVEIDAAGAVMIDHEPATADLSALIERLRAARAATGRKTMLLSADFATPHKNAVMAYDAANEVGLGIAIAKPSAKAPGNS